MIETGDMLLEYMYGGPIPTRKLADAEADLIFNLPHHGLEKKELQVELSKLFDAGYVEFFDIRIVKSDNYRTGLINPKTSINFDIDDKNILVFFTEEGGLRWEHIFEPDWDKYIYMVHDPSEDVLVEELKSRPIEMIFWQTEIVASSSELLEHVLSQIKDVTIGGTFEKMTTLLPWKLFDWKVLRKGYSVRFRMNEKNMLAAGDIVVNQNSNWKKSL